MQDCFDHFIKGSKRDPLESAILGTKRGQHGALVLSLQDKPNTILHAKGMQFPRQGRSKIGWLICLIMCGSWDIQTI